MKRMYGIARRGLEKRKSKIKRWLLKKKEYQNQKVKNKLLQGLVCLGIWTKKYYKNSIYVRKGKFSILLFSNIKSNSKKRLTREVKPHLVNLLCLKWYPQLESNQHLPLRRGLFYPLNYKDGYYILTNHKTHSEITKITQKAIRM